MLGVGCEVHSREQVAVPAAAWQADFGATTVGVDVDEKALGVAGFPATFGG